MTMWKWVVCVLAAIALSNCKPASMATSRANPRHGHLTEKEEIALKRNFYNGIKERLLGNYDNALDYFEKCLKIDSRHTASLYELARINDYKRNYNDALAYIRHATETDNDNPWLNEYYGDMLIKNEKYSQAAKHYRSLLEKSPENLEIMYSLTNCLLQLNDLKGTIDIYDRIEKIIGFDPSLSLQRERIYLELGDLDAATEELKKLIISNPEESRYYGMLGELYQMKGNDDEAYQTYLQLLKLDPDNPYIHLSLSDYYQKKGNEEAAFEEYKLAFENDNLDIDTKIQILLNYFGMSQSEKEKALRKQAFELCRILLTKHPDNPKTHAIYGDFLYREADQTAQALEQYKIALKLDETNFMIWNQVLLIESELNMTDSLLAESEKALELFPGQPAFYLFNGMAQIQKKNMEKAIQSLNSGLVLVFDNKSLLSQFYSNLGDAYHALKDYAASDSSYENALLADPKNSYVLNNYSYYLALRKTNLDRAEEMARLANIIQPHSPSYQDTYGWVLFNLGKYEDAKSWVQKAINNGGGESGVILEHLGDVLFMLGDVDGSVEYWKKALLTGQGSENLEKKIAEKNIE